VTGQSVQVDGQWVSVFEGKTACEHAETAAGAIRAINHLTFGETALPNPSDAWRLIGHVASLAARLPQAFEQVARQLQRWQQAGLIGIDPGTRYGGDPAVAVATASIYLTEDATVAVATLSEALDTVREALTYAHWTGPTDRGDPDQPRVGAGAS
jgi:hypothetical protein